MKSNEQARRKQYEKGISIWKQRKRRNDFESYYYPGVKALAYIFTRKPIVKLNDIKKFIRYLANLRTEDAGTYMLARVCANIRREM